MLCFLCVCPKGRNPPFTGGQGAAWEAGKPFAHRDPQSVQKAHWLGCVHLHAQPGGQTKSNPKLKKVFRCGFAKLRVFQTISGKGGLRPQICEIRGFLRTMACTDSLRKRGATGSPKMGGCLNTALCRNANSNSHWRCYVFCGFGFASGCTFRVC